MDGKLLKVKDEVLRPFDFPLNGKLITSVDPVKIGESDFQILQNFRYTSIGIKGVQGMTKINVSPTSYTLIPNGFQFLKAQPSESHIFVQTTSGGNSRLVKSNNTAGVPNQDTFSSFLSLPGNNIVYLSSAPDGCMVACDGTTNYVWGGNEYRCAQFLNFSPTSSFFYDYTQKVNNTLTDANNVATLVSVTGGLDSSTKLLLHLDNNVTDSSAGAHVVTNNSVTFDGVDFVFGGYSAVFNGTTAYLTTPDHADFDMSGGTWTIDCRIKIDSLAARRILYYQAIPVRSLAFSTGTAQINVGDTLVGGTSGATGTVDAVTVSSGSWGGGNAAGTIYLTAVTGVYQNAEALKVGGVQKATSGGVDGAAGSDSMTLSVETNGSVKLIVYEAGSGSNVVSVATAAGVISTATWYIVEAVENGNNYSIFVGTSGGTATLQAYAWNASRAHNYTSTVQIGTDGSSYFSGKMDEYRVSLAARNTSNFTVPLMAYGSGSTCFVYIGSTRPLQGVKFYVGTANTSAATATAYYWGGASWVTVGAVTDNTATAGKTLATTGEISFASTVSTANLKAINGAIAYFYQFQFAGIDSGVTITYCTLDAPIQPLTDIWDGVPRATTSFLTNDGTKYSDYTIQVSKSTYVAGDTSTYVNLGGMTTSQSFVVGFSERAMGIRLLLVGGNTNTTAGTILSVSYWNGTTWASAGAVDDGTLSGGTSLAQSGTITWNPPASSAEFPQTLNNSGSWYYYKITASQTLSANVFTYYVAGITAPKSLHNYRFPVLWQNRIFLMNDQTQRKYEAICSSQNSISVFNGADSISLDFGTDGELMAGASVYTRFGGSVYEDLCVVKRGETWVASGTGPSSWVLFQVSKTTGCPSPLTFKICAIGYEMAPGLLKHVLIWCSATGPVMFDGNSISPIMEDIKNFWDPADPNYINISMVGNFSGFYDERFKEYHLLFATGSNTTLNKEFAYDLLRKKTYEVLRGTGKALQCGFEAQDTSGNKYNYGGTTDGTIERLENGTTMDGNGMAYTFRLGDAPLWRTAMVETRMRVIKLTALSKTVDPTKVTMTHFADTRTSGTALTTMAQSAATGRRVYQIDRSVGIKAIFHSVQCSVTTTSETIGFEPILLSGLFKVEAVDVLREG